MLSEGLYIVHVSDGFYVSEQHDLLIISALLLAFKIQSKPLRRQATSFTMASLWSYARYFFNNTLYILAISIGYVAGNISTFHDRVEPEKSSANIITEWQ